MMKARAGNLWLLVFVVVSSSVFAAEAEQADGGRRTADGETEMSRSAAESAGPAVDTSAAGPLPNAESNASQSSSSPSAVRTPPSTAPGAADRLELDTTVVTGNRELPKVLYIVPWKKADLGDLPAQPFNTLLDEVLTPVDRDVFRREVTYFEAVSDSADATQSTSRPQQ